MRHVQFNYTFVYVSSPRYDTGKMKSEQVSSSDFRSSYSRNMPVLFDANRFDLESLDSTAEKKAITELFKNTTPTISMKLISPFRLDATPYT